MGILVLASGAHLNRRLEARTASAVEWPDPQRTQLMALTVGTRLGHYDVTTLLGKAGWDRPGRPPTPSSNRDVALKILHDAFAADPDRRARFQPEAPVFAEGG